MLAIGQSLMFQSAGNPAQVQQELNKLQSLPRRRDSPQTRVAPPEAATKPSNLLKPQVPARPSSRRCSLTTLDNGELEIAVSNNGTNIVVAKQSGFVTSNDGGQTFPFSGNLPSTTAIARSRSGRAGTFTSSTGMFRGQLCRPLSS